MFVLLTTALAIAVRLFGVETAHAFEQLIRIRSLNIGFTGSIAVAAWACQWLGRHGASDAFFCT
jgi:hypothetical protein